MTSLCSIGQRSVSASPCVIIIYINQIKLQVLFCEQFHVFVDCILDLIDYADYCQQVAFAYAIEADLTLLDAAAVAADYVEKYGEPEAAAE